MWPASTFFAIQLSNSREYWILAGSQENSLRNFQTELNTKANAENEHAKHTKDDFPNPERLQNTGFLGKIPSLTVD